MVVSACKWTPELLVQFEAFCQSGAITPPVFAELRKKSATCPPRCEPHMLRTYREKSLLHETAREKYGTTWQRLARHREYFKHAVLCVHTETDCFWLRVLH
eukprot:6292030-Amphidinium_carterae.1